MKKRKIAFLSALLAGLINITFADEINMNKGHVDSLKLYSEVTSLTMAFNEKYGKEFRLPVNAKDSVKTILENSNTKKYMDTKPYNDYGSNSQFSIDAHKMMSDLKNLINQFKEIGFINEIKLHGQTPAIMFDIDNTIELTSFDDDYFTKSGINDPATSEFIKSVCFKDGIACYFITARTCNKDEALATKEWLKVHLKLSNNELNHYVFLSGSVPANACTSESNVRVAYKDVLRQALTDQRHVYWLMSIGDQMTDWFGKNSGLKVWYPNEMFDSSIVENNHNNRKEIGTLQKVIAPSKQCYKKLQKNVLEYSTLQYCQLFKKDKYLI
ncbi:HAD family acid phosphatase [Thiotrichales bacterium 19X7-9]|nr:HAD family acid phosphatase [Thiotrichales bacterium 19X7-9]